MSGDVNLQTVAKTTITLPANCFFYVDEVGVIVDSVGNLTVQPEIIFGYESTDAGILSNTTTTTLSAVGTRQRYTSLLDYNGHSVLTASVTIAATADNLHGRFYWKGMLVENPL